MWIFKKIGIFTYTCLFTSNHKTLLGQIKENLNKREEMYHTCELEVNTLTMSILNTSQILYMCLTHIHIQVQQNSSQNHCMIVC